MARPDCRWRGPFSPKHSICSEPIRCQTPGNYARRYRTCCRTLSDSASINHPLQQDQWDLARLPIQAGGLYLPHLPRLAVIARTAALATMPTASRTTSYRHNLLKEERAELFARLRGFCHTEPTALAGDLDDTLQGMSLRHLSRKLTQSRDSAAINAFWLRRQDLPARLRHAWLCNLPEDNPARPATYHGHGDWLHTLPGRWETTLLDPVFKWGLQHRMGFPAPGAGFKCGRTRGANPAMPYSTTLDDTQDFATKVFTQDDTIWCATTSPKWPARRD